MCADHQRNYRLIDYFILGDNYFADLLQYFLMPGPQFLN
jgi:hypothetical protein